MLREVQPSIAQRIYHSMKQAERQSSQVQQPRRELQQQSTMVDNPQPVRTWKEEIKAYGERLHRTGDEYLAKRAKESNNYPSWRIEDWEAYCEMRKNQEPLHEAPLLPKQQKPDKVKTSEQRKGIATGMYKELVQEVASRQMDDTAKILKKEVWGDNPRASVNRYGQMEINIHSKTGVVKDRSFVGYSLAESERNLYFGIRYVGDDSKEKIIQEARGSVSDADLEKGAKAYFIEKTKGVTKEVTLIPFAYAEATNVFLDRLHEEAIDLASSPTSHRRQTPPQPQQLAA